MGKTRQSNGGGNQSVDYTAQNIINLSPSQVEQYVDTIRNMSDEELMKTYSEFVTNWTYVVNWDGARRTSKFINSLTDDLNGDDGILRGDVDNLNQQFLNLNRVRLELGTEMLTRDLDNEYGYPDIPYYEIINGRIQFRPFTPTND